MPELDIQRRQGIPAWVWVIGALILALIIWWIVAAANEDRELAGVGPAGPTERVAGERVEVVPVEPGPQPLTSAEWLPLAAMRANPDNYFGQTISGVGTVVETVGDYAFWIEQRGARVLVITDQRIPAPEVVVAGREVWLTGVPRDPQYLQQYIDDLSKLPTPLVREIQGMPVFIEAQEIRASQPQP